jgi:beta-glucanase (GH16 family)
MFKKSILYFLSFVAITFIWLSYTYAKFEAPIEIGEKITRTQFDTLIWSDEFEGEGMIDTTKWFHQTQIPPWGEWFGGIIQHYTNRVENTYLADGMMHMAAIKEPFEDQGLKKEYTSARLNSKFAFTYGRVEVRAKLPEGVGTWPAIWMLSTSISEDGAYWEQLGYGTTPWPHCGEIDIMEHWGNEQNYVSSAVHNGSSYGGDVVNLGGRLLNDVSNSFHIYGLEWTKDYMIFSIDGIVHYVYQPFFKTQKTWPYDSDQYFLMNIAIEPDIDPEFTRSEMVVDYIRVYQ